MLEDGAVGADHRLNAGYPVNGPEEENTRALREEPRVNAKEKRKKNVPCGSSILDHAAKTWKKQTGMLLTVARQRRKQSQSGSKDQRKRIFKRISLQ